MLTKARSVLSIHPLMTIANSPGLNDGSATYVTLDADGNISDTDPDCLFITIDYNRFLELGAPETVTVTVEPGDTLN